LTSFATRRDAMLTGREYRPGGPYLTYNTVPTVRTFY